MKEYFDIIVLGGGASGLAAAITAKRQRPELSVAVLEKKEKVGLKLKATGNGRCNISNMNCENREEVLAFLESCGIALRREEDRLYPLSEEAGQVVEALVIAAEEAGVEIFKSCDIKKAEKNCGAAFTLTAQDKRVFAAGKLLIATGGKSYGNFGTTGDGYIIAREMGHKVTTLIPALTAIEVEEDLETLKGIRVKGAVRLYRDDSEIFYEEGEIQFRQDSLSGICIMNASLMVRRGENISLGIDLLKESIDVGENVEETALWLKKRCQIAGATVFDVLRTLVKEPLAMEILAVVNMNLDKKGSALRGEDIDIMARTLRDFRLTVKGLKGWNEAQVTAGGVLTEDVNEKTMESKIVPGLFFAGEVLDFAGKCGGYNLHQAWLTGIRAGRGMSNHV